MILSAWFSLLTSKGRLDVYCTTFVIVIIRKLIKQIECILERNKRRFIQIDFVLHNLAVSVGAGGIRLRRGEWRGTCDGSQHGRQVDADETGRRHRHASTTRKSLLIS